jgi:hypothetical protein
VRERRELLEQRGPRIRSNLVRHRDRTS